jgi:hypothetical protein
VTMQFPLLATLLVVSSGCQQHADSRADSARDTRPSDTGPSDDSSRRGDARTDAITLCGLSISKAKCPWPSGGSTCPVGQFCLDFAQCATVGCSELPDCVQKPEAYYVSRSPFPASADLKPTMATVSSFAGSTVELSTGPTTVILGVSLPGDMSLPITVGQRIEIQVCGTGPFRSGFLIAKDESGRLLFAGGRNADVSKSPCVSAAGFSLERAATDCAPQRFGPEPDGGLGVAFAIKFVADDSVTVSQGRRGALTIGGKSYTAAVFQAYHTVEWPAYDIYGAPESLAVVLNH